MADRDILPDLEIRLKRIDALRDEAQRRYERELEEIKRNETVLREMIELEKKGALNGYAPKVELAGPLRAGAQNRTEHEILQFLSDEQEHRFDDVRANLLSVGIGNEDDPNWGRSVFGLLLSMRGRELVDMPKPRRWRITKKGLTGE